VNDITGYSDRWSVTTDETVRFMISSDRDYQLDLVRLRHGDPRPGGPGILETVVARYGTYPARHQLVRCGSYVEVPDASQVGDLDAVSMQAWIWPTIPNNPVGQGIVSALPMGRWGLVVEPSGQLALRLVVEDQRLSLAVAEPLRSCQWYFVCAAINGRQARLWQRPVSRGLGGPPEAAAVFDDLRLGPLPAPSEGLAIAACEPRADGERRTRAYGHFNGKIASPRVFFDLALDDDAVDQLAQHRPPAMVPGARRFCAWDFTPRTDDQIPDLGPLGLHGRAVNLPTRAVTGPNWSGREVDFRAVPTQYAAIHFHEDDLEDAGWQTGVEVTIPSDTQSGVYAARIGARGAIDRIPFFVRPAAGAAADVAVVFPTMTYLAYANQRGQFDEELADSGLFGRDLVPDPRDYWLDRHPELGGSLYDLHRDGSGHCHSSRLRPIANLRPDHLNWVMQAPRHLGADLYLVDWLERHDVSWDALTDEDLDDHGQALLDAYPVVITGSHPEYVTERMLDAVEGYIRAGGRLMYLGGNGFYWVTGRPRPHAIEVRRGISGTRVWESQPGEQQLTCGQPGGLWRHRGRPPNALVGVGFAAEGWDEQTPGYRRRLISYDPAYAWIFDGVEEDVIGDFGRVMGGAAGDEIDRFDKARGSPRIATVLASSEGHSRFYQPATEDVRMIVPGLHGALNPDIRADMTLLEIPESGGAVFSVGSICWIGSLPHNDYDNNVSRITWNVLAAFSQQSVPYTSDQTPSRASWMGLR
jgi:N,N-dimethylformamidase